MTTLTENLKNRDRKLAKPSNLDQAMQPGLLQSSATLVTFCVLRLRISRRSPFKHHHFPREIFRCAVRWYLRFPLSYKNVVDLLAERGVDVDRSTVPRWVQKFGNELFKLTKKHLRCASVDWHLGETYIRVGGKWHYLWRADDANGQMFDFRLTAL